MARLIYVLDSNVIADRMYQRQPLMNHLTTAVAGGHQVVLCQPVYYEVMRGLLKANAKRKQAIFQNDIMPFLDWQPLTDEDWRQAAQFWADTRSRGIQFSDIDLLMAAIARRLGGVLISADDDFDSLPVPRENWRA